MCRGVTGKLSSEVADLKRIHEEARKEKMEAKKRAWLASVLFTDN
jgi:hypothetical protein